MCMGGGSAWQAPPKAAAAAAALLLVATMGLNSAHTAIEYVITRSMIATDCALGYGRHEAFPVAATFRLPQSMRINYVQYKDK